MNDLLVKVYTKPHLPEDPDATMETSVLESKDENQPPPPPPPPVSSSPGTPLPANKRKKGEGRESKNRKRKKPSSLDEETKDAIKDSHINGMKTLIKSC